MKGKNPNSYLLGEDSDSLDKDIIGYRLGRTTRDVSATPRDVPSSPRDVFTSLAGYHPGDKPAKPVAVNRRTKRKIYSDFLLGPVPMPWLMLATSTSVTARAAIMIWYLSGVASSETFAISNIEAGKWGLDRKQKQYALGRLAALGLITTERIGYASVRVTILKADGSTTDAQALNEDLRSMGLR